MKRSTWVVPIVAALCGIVLGEALWRGAVDARSSAAPPDWIAEDPEVPYRLGSLMGQVPPDPQAWSLDFWRTLWPNDPHLRSGPAPIRAWAMLPMDGQLELWTALPRGTHPQGGVALVLERVGSPSSRVVQVQRAGRRTLACSGALPAPGDAPVSARIEPMQGGVSVEVDGTSVRCSASLPQAGPALRPGLRRVQLRGLEVGEVPIDAPGPGLRPLWWLSGALVTSGLAGLELWLGARAILVLLSTLPLLLSALFMGGDVRTFAETARLTWLPVAWLPVMGPAALALGLKALHFLGRLLVERADPDGIAPRDWPMAAPLAAATPAALAMAASPHATSVLLAGALGLTSALSVAATATLAFRLLGSGTPRRSASWALAAGALAACAIGLTDPLHWLAPGLAGVAVLCLGGLTWAQVNAGRVRLYNLTSLALFCGMIVAAEGSVRLTPAGAGWGDAGSRTRRDDIYGWVPEANDSFALLEEGRHTAYPDRGYPVAIPAESGRPRLVAMGGSTTGGAFQNDDLREFYPALVQSRLGGALDVVNQGVGGWTTWHIRRYLDDHLDSLNPSVLTLYVGHNDLMTPVPIPYDELYHAWRGRQGSRRLARMLSGVRLYQAFRYGLSALRPSGRRVAVPLEDARENLIAVSEQVVGRGGRVVLASEGLAPDPAPLSEYNRMMARLADDMEGVSYVPTAERLHEWSGERLFVDDCHLTRRGHEVVAEAFVRELERLGVVGGQHDAP